MTWPCKQCEPQMDAQFAYARGLMAENERLQEAGDALADAVSDIMGDDSESVLHHWAKQWREAQG